MFSKKIIFLLFLLMFLFTVITPVLVYNKLIFVVLLLVSLHKPSIYSHSPLIIFLIFLVGFCISFLGNRIDRELSIQFLVSVSILFLINIIVKYDINLDKIVKIAGLVICFFTLFFFYFIVINLGEMPSDLISDFYFKNMSGAYGSREILDGGTELFHLGTVPFLFIPFTVFLISYVTSRKLFDILCLILITIVIVISGSRGLVITCLINFILIIMYHSSKRNRIIIVSIIVPTIYFLVSFLYSQTQVFNITEESNGVKVGHFNSFLKNINTFNLLFGDGLAAYYFSSGRNAFVAHTELTPIDMIRYFGFIQAVILFAVLLFPIKNVINYANDKKIYVITFVLYLIFSITNPILFNSFGLLVVLWYWSKVLIVKKQDNENL